VAEGKKEENEGAGTREGRIASWLLGGRRKRLHSQAYVSQVVQRHNVQALAAVMSL